MYKLEIAKSVEKDFRKIPYEKHPLLFKAIESLALNPFPPTKYKKLKGKEISYRLRVGNYRILYDVRNTVKIITVYRVRHRKDVYKK